MADPTIERARDGTVWLVDAEDQSWRVEDMVRRPPPIGGWKRDYPGSNPDARYRVFSRSSGQVGPDSHMVIAEVRRYRFTRHGEARGFDPAVWADQLERAEVRPLTTGESD